ncbi:unnamed protein product, partial [Nippostrongylus brasiliensis]|uniref:WW domain-containing protein n=1 Tax=Nippostrongylus brasiliensis TaxID=27835 RepID=A0A0N4YUX8_NIPBR
MVNKVMEFFHQLPSDEQKKWNEYYKKECVQWLKEVASDDEISELKKLESSSDKDQLATKVFSYLTRLSGEKMAKVEIWKVSDMKASGKSFDEIRKKTTEYFDALPDDKQSSLKEEFKGKCKAFFRKIATPEEMEKMKSLHEAGSTDELCGDVFDVKSKRKRDIDEKINRKLSWMSDDQKQVVKQMYADGKPQAEIRAKIFQYLSSLDGPSGAAAKEQTQKECYKWMDDVATPEEIAALHKMHETDHAGCKKKSTRRRRAHDIDEGMTKFLSWLTDEQKEKVKALHASGDREAFYKEILEIFDEASGDVKIDAAERLKEACKHYGKDVIGEENINVLKQMKESGASKEAIAEKVEEIVEGISDEEKKATAVRLTKACKKIYGTTRARRDHHHTLEEALQKYLTWLNDDQKEELESLSRGGDKEGVYKKIMEFFQSATGDVKDKAADELKAGCRHYITAYVGEEKAAELRTMKEEGKSVDEIAVKAEEAVEDITDEATRTKAKKAVAACKKIYGAARFRRSHKHSLSEAMSKYLTWLNDDQKSEIESLYAEGNRGAVYEKILEFFDDAEGETKQKAAVELKGACKHYVRDLIGEENGNLIRKMKEEGASNDDIATKVEEMIEAIADDKKKAQALRASTACKKIYGVARRFRRDHHEHTIEEALEKYLTWLNDDQKAEVKKLYEADGREAAYKKVMEWFEGASGDVKEKAGVELKAACKHYVMDYIGEENAGKIKEMKESGASNDDIAAKINEFIAAISDETKKAKAEKAAVVCRKIYGVARRFRRDHHEHKLEEAMEKYLTWLNDDQKAEVKKLYETGGREEVYKKVMAWFEGASGDVKEKAAVELKAA